MERPSNGEPPTSLVVGSSLPSRTADRRADAGLKRRRPSKDKPDNAITSGGSKWAKVRASPTKVAKGFPENDKAQRLWLEAIDSNHRYGSNLKSYYKEWFHSRSEEAFFQWLDSGEGKGLDLSRCPRSLLEQQRIRYLAPSDREAYEVVVRDGKLIYKQTQEPLNTTADAKWIFVLSPSRILYVGRKKKGEFHHSSFLAGAAAIAGGRLVAQNGILKGVWPWSSHFTHTEENFKEFILFLTEKNVDLTNIRDSSEYMLAQSAIGSSIYAMRDEAENRNVKIIPEWVFIIINLALELLLLAMEQFVSPSRSYFSLIALLASLATILVCVLEISYDTQREDKRIIGLQVQQWMKWSFFCPSSGQKPMAMSSFLHVFGFVSAVAQFILSLVAYCFYCRYGQNPIKISIVSVIFIIVVACSKLAPSNGRSESSLEFAVDHQV